MSKPRTGAIFTQDILHDVTRAMEAHGTSGEEAEHVFRRKINALQKFLQHGMSRFSVETLQHVLYSLSETDTGDMDVTLNISSLREVRNVVKRAIMKRESGSFRTSDVDSLHYMELFFYCIYCMSEAKRLFELLYDDLFYSYYNPDELSRQNTRTTSASRNPGVIKRIDGLTEAQHYSQFGISTLDLMTGSTHHKLKQTVQDMRMVLNRWTNLLTENELNYESFDMESEQDLIRLHGASGMEPVLRLVPDMFAKYYKCLELAKQWWVIAHEIYTGLPFQRRPSIAEDSENNSRVSSVTLQDMSIEDENDSAEIDNETESDEVSNTLGLIQTLSDDIEVLERREEKFEVLIETYNKVGNDIDHLHAKRNKLLIEKETIKANGIPEEIANIEGQLSSNNSKIKLLEFQHALLFEDYAIHLELRPSVIRFLHDAKAQLGEAHKTLVAQRSNKNSEQSDVHVSNENNNKLINSNISHSYQSEYSLQSIERGVQTVSDKCVELQQENSIMRARKQSLSKLNKKHSQQNLVKKTVEDNNTRNVPKISLDKFDHNNNIEIKGPKPPIKSSRFETTKTDQKATNRNDKKETSLANDRSKYHVTTAKGIVSETSRVQNDKKMKNTSDNSKPRHQILSNDRRKSQSTSLVNYEKSSRLKPVQEIRKTAQKTQPAERNSERSVRNDRLGNEQKTSIKQNGTVSKTKKPEQKALADRKISNGDGDQSSSTTEKENVAQSKVKQNPPMSTQMDKKRPR